MLKLALAYAFLISLIVFLRFLIKELRRTYYKDVHVIWYFFSLAFICTICISIWAIKYDAVDSHGGFQGDNGHIIEGLLNCMLDINTDFAIITAIVAIITLPQCLSYMLSGLSGCSSEPIFISVSLRFLIWSFIKFFSVAAGIILPLSFIGWLKGWNGSGDQAFAGRLLFSAIVLNFSFVLLYTYRNFEQLLMHIKNNLPTRLLIILRRIHAWNTRNSS